MPLRDDDHDNRRPTSPYERRGQKDHDIPRKDEVQRPDTSSSSGQAGDGGNSGDEG